MEARFDKDQFNENELISFSFPLSNPYQIDQKTFERVDGEISFQGMTYKFVKRKVSDGNLILLCIPDNQKMLLKKAKNDFGNSANDLPNNGKSQRSGSQKNFSGSDYTAPVYQLNIGLTAIDHNSVNTDFSIEILSDPHITSPGKPPQYRA